MLIRLVLTKVLTAHPTRELDIGETAIVSDRVQPVTEGMCLDPHRLAVLGQSALIEDALAVTGFSAPFRRAKRVLDLLETDRRDSERVGCLCAVKLLNERHRKAQREHLFLSPACEEWSVEAPCRDLGFHVPNAEH